MSQSMSSERIQRLNTLLKVLHDNPYINREDLMTKCGYVSSRTLENDLRFMRRSFGAEIKFSRSRQGYIFVNAGKFVLFRSSPEEENYESQSSAV